MTRVLGVLCSLIAVGGLVAAALPLSAKEVSLMLRSGYSSEAVLRELETRKFADTFDSGLEKELVKAGANQLLIQALQSGKYQLSGTEIATFKTRQSSEAVIRKANEISPTANQSAPASHPAVVQIGGSMYDHLKGDLVYWHEGSLVPFDDEALQNKKLYLLFFSGFWSKEGRQFTSRLVDYYNRVPAEHREFEVIFFSVDRSEFVMEDYINKTNMPWPALAFDKRQGKAGAIQDTLVHSIPHLILADADGRILSDSGDQQPDLDKVLADLEKLRAASQ
jgi:Thioredoxin-like